MREYLEALDVAGTKTTRKISLTDPAASFTAFPSGGAFYAYSTNYLIDTDHGIIVDVEPSTANRSHEVATTKTMVERVANYFGLKPQRLIGDTAYGTSAMLGWMVEEQGIAPHVPVWDKTERKDGCFSRRDFTWDAQLQEYRCPAGKPLRSRQRHYKQRDSLVTTENTILYFARKHDCDLCPMKGRCCPNMPARKIARSVYEDARDVARGITKTDAYLRSRKERKKVEMLFAHLKRTSRTLQIRLQLICWTGFSTELARSGRIARRPGAVRRLIQLTTCLRQIGVSRQLALIPRGDLPERGSRAALGCSQGFGQKVTSECTDFSASRGRLSEIRGDCGADALLAPVNYP